MNNELKADLIESGDTLEVTLVGSVDEDAEFPEIDSSRFKSLTVDLNGIKTINSIGIRTWLSWVSPLQQAGLAFTFSRVPYNMILQCNMIKDFVPNGSTITSFYIPIYCENCDDTIHHLTQPSNLTGLPDQPRFDLDSIAPTLCAQATCRLELDCPETSYFQFLKNVKY